MIFIKSNYTMWALIFYWIVWLLTDLWREDLGRKMNIGVSASGFDEIKLECAEDALDVSIRMEKDFNGVIYVRGNFYARQEPCFLEAHGGRQFHMAIPFHDCKIQTVSLN